jgi:hypothetical protein
MGAKHVHRIVSCAHHPQSAPNVMVTTNSRLVEHVQVAITLPLHVCHAIINTNSTMEQHVRTAQLTVVLVHLKPFALTALLATGSTQLGYALILETGVQ